MAKSVGKVYRTILYPFLGLAWLGMAASLSLHLLAMLQFRLPPAVICVFLGIFPVAVPAVLGQAYHWQYFTKETWWVTIKQFCPKWMQRLINAMLIYGPINLLLLITVPWLGEVIPALRDDPPLFNQATFGFVLMFYTLLMTLLYTEIRVSLAEDGKRGPS